MKNNLETTINEQKELFISVIKELDDIKKRIESALSDMHEIKTEDDIAQWIEKHNDIDAEFKYVTLRSDF